MNRADILVYAYFMAEAYGKPTEILRAITARFLALIAL